MIYLITVHNRKKMISNLDIPEQLNCHVWKTIMTLTKHKTILYGIPTFNALEHTALPNRVNILFARSTSETRKLKNVLVNNHIKELIQPFAETNDDLYVIGSNKQIIETFAKHVDFIIDFTTEEIKSTTSNIFDSINFADFNLLKRCEETHYDTRYFVREKTNFIGY